MKIDSSGHVLSHLPIFRTQNSQHIVVHCLSIRQVIPKGVFQQQFVTFFQRIPRKFLALTLISIRIPMVLRILYVFQ